MSVEVMRLAFEALDKMMGEFKAHDLPYGSEAYALAKDARLDLYRAIASAKRAEAERQEPVAEVIIRRDGVSFAFWLGTPPSAGTKLYTTPPQRQPLTDEYIDQHIGPDEGDREAITRATGGGREV